MVGYNSMNNAFEEVSIELVNATDNHSAMASAHEGYAVILEELDELWEEVKKKPTVRSQTRMREEAKQVAAMAIRFMMDVTEREGSKG